MSKFVKAVAFVFPVLLAACAVDKSPPSQPSTKVGALGDPSVTTDASGYQSGAPVMVNYDGLPGNAHDWIAIAPAGAPADNYVAWVYTGGLTTGTATFWTLADGRYVARAFLNDTFTMLAESAPFTVGPAISTDKASYAPGETVTVTYAGLPGNQRDWIGISPAGSPASSYVAFVYTNGQTGGTATFTAPSSGSFVARAYLNDTFTVIAESAPFTIGVPTISTDQSSYAPGATVTVTYAG